MAAPSMFSTQDNLDRLNLGIERANTAIKEAELMKKGNIDGADALLKQAQEALAFLENLKSVYFPTGTVPIKPQG